jgi:uncharacterized protein YkwD
VACIATRVFQTDAPIAAAAFRTAQTISIEAGAYELYQLQNAARLAAGVPAVQPNSYLQIAAQQHAERMAAFDFYSHADPYTGTGPSTRTYLVGYRLATRVAEVIDLDPESPSKVLQKFRGSPDHWAIMLDREFNEVGVGHAVAISAAGTKHYWVIDYGAGVNAQGTPTVGPPDAVATTLATPVPAQTPPAGTPIPGAPTSTPTPTPRPSAGTTRTYLPNIVR